jgi:PAS domain S-box-containing protein
MAPSESGQDGRLTAEQHFRVFLQSVRDYAFITFDPDNRITSWSAGAEDISGWTEAEALGQSGAMFFTPEDRANRSVEQELEAARRNGRVENERWHLRKDGSRFWGSGIMTVLRDDRGELVGFAKVLRDLTERRKAGRALRESEERFRLFVENVQEYALFQTDPETRITSWNPGAERLFGYKSAEMIGQSASRLFTREDQQARILEQEIARASVGERQEDARWVVRKDGSRFWAQWVTEPVRDEAGQLLGVAKVLRDETERQKTDEAIRASLAEKEALLKEIHHRVKNNLQVIVSLLSLQADQIADPVALEMFRDTQSRVRSIARIHETLYSSKDLAEIEFGEYTRVLVQDLFGFYGISKDRIRYDLQIEDMAISITQAIPLGLILNELVVNCLKHAFPDDRHGTIRVSLGYLLEELGSGQTLDEAPGQLCVEDDGVGLPPDFKIEHADSMGMYLVRILTRQLRGKLTLESREGQGTRICLRFPLSVEEAHLDL